jgi:DNA-binding NtrC family response regulator
MARQPTVLIVDDEPNILTSLSRMLSLEGFSPMVAGSGRVAFEKLAETPADALLLDVRLPEMDGLQILGRMREQYPDIPVIMMSGHANLEIAVHAIQSGAHDFIEKPVGTDRLLLTLGNALRFNTLQSEHRTLSTQLQHNQTLLGDSHQMAELREAIALAAPSRGRVLITGENGTGKELIARAIHEGSTRANGPFIKVNCAAIPSELIESELFGHEKGAFTGAHQARKGKFELADGGTLFLDEIGDMRLDVQAKLLRVLQEEEVERVGGSKPVSIDVRILTATNKVLSECIAQETFREDLYYRINVVPITAPPLRNRRSDIPMLIAHFMALACDENNRPKKTLTAAAIELLVQHTWPGNVRELKNTCERLVILTTTETVDTPSVQRLLPTLQAQAGTGYARDTPLRYLVAEAERAFIQAALDDHGGHVTNAANSLGLERSHLYKKMKALGLR